MIKTKKRQYKNRPGVYECKECGKHLETARALAGHMWFAHNIRYGERHNLRREIQELQSNPKINPEVDELIKQANIALGEIAEMRKDLLKIGTRIEELARKDNPGDLPNPKPMKEEEPDDEDNLLDFSHTTLDDDDKEKSEKTDETGDDDSPFL